MTLRKKDQIVPVVSAIIVIALGAAGYYYWVQMEQEAMPPPAKPVAEAPAATSPPTPPPEPQIRYPIQAPQTEQARPLPPLVESDAAVQEKFTELVDKEQLKRFNWDNAIRRFVVTVEELPRQSVPQKYHVAKPVLGKFITTGKDESLELSRENYRRYAPYVALLESIDTKKLAAAYVYFYPLLQEEHQNLGHTKKYFNDRLVEAIDDFVAAPELKSPIRLVQPKVFYEFADPALEKLSAGQKIMIRIGPENAARVKAKLREIRDAITAAR